MMSIFVAILLAWLLALGWAIICNERTYRQRDRLIDAIAAANREAQSFARYWPALKSVEYGRHLWLLITFRDPWREYVGLPPGFPGGAK